MFCFIFGFYIINLIKIYFLYCKFALIFFVILFKNEKNMITEFCILIPNFINSIENSFFYEKRVVLKLP